MHDAVIVSAVRTPVGKAPKGALRFTRPDELAALVVREALAAPATSPAVTSTMWSWAARCPKPSRG
jgi:acetyl-CoA acyltransferase